MKGTPSDAFRALAEGAGIVVEFGQSGADGAIALSDRVRLPLDTAKRLVLALNEPLARHAARLQAAERAAARGDTPVNAPRDAAAEKAATLLQAVGALGVPCQHERSFRLAAGSLAANRFLLTVNAADVPASRALEICERFAMPSALREQATEHYARAACVHFGFEAGADGMLAKLYLERAVPAEEARSARERREPVLLHLAFKWDIATGAAVVTQYRWFPDLGADEMAQRLVGLYGGESASCAIAQSVLALAASRTAPQRLQYLEVHEPDNGRRSFDLNVYDAALQVKDLQGPLARMREHFGVRPGELQALYDQIKSRPFGHLAGGVHRNGREFFNVYYGVVGLPRFMETAR